eukprot:CAMPEP_0174744244 /NCGR_PEP_ID=MMETSP1094-20130205/83762_1 /TAXON_ID=156173 /ORGANISM="Chrysochromulina brevifilum, Strain UTEX LB 985" /LENGTH=71 /DNA_ID=CAMNT_0015948589 /DNA_START=35 /DNA_END=247 /DNA_ORIENTATION=-
MEEVRGLQDGQGEQRGLSPARAWSVASPMGGGQREVVEVHGWGESVCFGRGREHNLAEDDEEYPRPRLVFD